MKKVSQCKKKISLVLVIIFIAFLFVFCKDTDKISQPLQYEEDNWNNGYCIEDGGRLNYKSVGTMYHYECEICHKEYRFKQVMSHK